MVLESFEIADTSVKVERLKANDHNDFFHELKLI